MSKAAEATKVTPRLLGLISAPVITEKSTLGSEHGQITFKVPLDATKPENKSAIEALYKAKVKAVNTTILKGKSKRFKGIMGTRSDVKKAIVTLEKGQTIDISAAV